MPYCTEPQVRAIVDTDIANADIVELIEETDAWITFFPKLISMGASN